MSIDLQRVFRRIQHMIKPARLAKPSTESGVVQRIQVQLNPIETREVSSVQHYGFAASLPKGTDVMIVNVSGDGGNGVAIGSNHQTHRPKGMKAGAVRIYNDAGSYVHVEGGKITIVARTEVTITTPKLKVSGDIEATGDVKAGTVSLKQHRHTDVQSGITTSGPPQ